MTIRKYTQKELRHLVAEGYAQDLTNKGYNEVEEIRKAENGFRQLGYASGVYGVNGALLQGYNSGEWYAIHKRSGSLLQLV